MSEACNNNHPMVSVVMLAYNSAQVLADAIRGVVHQKVPFPIELIIADDASTDSTLSVARQWQRRYPDIIRIIANPRNIGLQSNYLNAIRNCQGKYLAMCDADDYWTYSKKLAAQVGYMESHPDCNVTFHRVINHYTDTGAKSLSNGTQKADTDISDLCRSNYITNLSVMYRFDHGHTIDLPEWLSKTHIPDYALHLLFTNSGRIHYFKRPMGVYRKHSKAVWSLADPIKGLMMGVQERKLLLEHFKYDNDVTHGLRSLCNRSLVKAACMTIKSGEDISQFTDTYTEINPDSNKTDFLEAVREYETTPGRKATELKSKIRQTVRNLITRIIPVPGPC